MSEWYRPTKTEAFFDEVVYWLAIAYGFVVITFPIWLLILTVVLVEVGGRK